MKLEIKLKDPKKCDGCPFNEQIVTIHHPIKYEPEAPIIRYCKFYKKLLAGKRFQKCIDDNGR